MPPSGEMSSLKTIINCIVEGLGKVPKVLCIIDEWHLYRVPFINISNLAFTNIVFSISIIYKFVYTFVIYICYIQYIFSTS